MKCDHIRTREQGDTPFYPNMLNNCNVEICLKEDVDAAIAELKSKIQLDEDEMAGFLQLEEECGGGDLLKVPQEGGGIQMTQEELDKIVEQHQHWLKEDCEGWEGMKADLTGADLTGADLTRANLRHADLTGADLTRANLRHADLSGAVLSDANLTRADLTGANLRHADLSGAVLVLDEPLTGYKITQEGVVIIAEIPAGAIVFCINGKKCRTNRAKITDMGGHDVLHSQYDDSFEYRLGQEINIKDFNLMYNVECASGFHFFRTRKEAEEYR